jgi:Na+-transporting NADH:ubiquinone oxidoreductase subunit F
MPRITFQASSKVADAEPGEWMFEVCDRVQAGVPFACKAGACGTCATPVLAGLEHLAPPTARELRTLGEAGLDQATYRLPCLKDVGDGDVTFGQPKNAAGAALATHEVEVESFRPLNLTVAEVRFFIKKPFSFQPGQYMIFHIPHTGQVVRRSYSISTPPADKRHFEICVRSVSGGHGSNYVHRLRPGNQIQVEGPFGDFVLDEGSERDILMIATGTGISPIKSMLMHLLHQRSRRRVRLFFGVRHEADLFYVDLLRGLAAHYPEFEGTIVQSQPDSARWSGPRGRVTDLIAERVTAADAARTDVYLCGGRPMIEASLEQLRALGFPPESLRHERFF